MRKTRKTASRKVRSLMDQAQYQAAERLLLQQLAQETHNVSFRVECYSNLGNVAEAQGRVGDAFRHWSKSLSLLADLGLAETAEGERLRRLIRLWHEDTPRVWVSYSHRDAHRVDKVVRVLRRSRIDVMWDKDFLAGHSIQAQVLAAIQRCPKHIVFWSKASEKSEWVQYEKDFLGILRKQRSRDRSEHALDNIIIFYCFDGASPGNDFRDDVQIPEKNIGFATAIDRLIRSIRTSALLAALS
jgi:tetratricopeptide (TPR) repeat protein